MRTTLFATLLCTLLFLVTISTRTQPTSAISIDTQSVSETSVDRLSFRGPQLPRSFDANNFAMFYIVRGNWPIVIRYELAKGSARFELKPMQRGNPVSVDLPATSEGKVGKVSISTPDEYGGVPQPAEVRIVANGSDFVLHSLGCGGGAFVNDPERRRRPNANPDEVFNHFTTTNQQAATDEVAIGGITFSPRDILDASKGAQLSLSFESTNDFPMWSLAFERQVQGSGSRWQIERFIAFPTDPINQGQTKKSSWDGKDENGKVVGGRYKVMVNAWTSAAQDGSAITTFSSPAFIVK